MGDIGPAQQQYDVLPLDDPGRVPAADPPPTPVGQEAPERTSR